MVLLRADPKVSVNLQTDVRLLSLEVSLWQVNPWVDYRKRSIVGTTSK